MYIAFFQIEVLQTNFLYQNMLVVVTFASECTFENGLYVSTCYGDIRFSGPFSRTWFFVRISQVYWR